MHTVYSTIGNSAINNIAAELRGTEFYARINLSEAVLTTHAERRARRRESGCSRLPSFV